MAKRLAKFLKDGDADVVVRFDYSKVPVGHQEPLREDAKAIRSNLIRAAGYLMDTHGAWLPWVEAEAGMSAPKGRDAIKVFRRFRDTPLLFADLDLALPETAIVRLAASPGLPDRSSCHYISAYTGVRCITGSGTSWLR
ncbi:MAG TPA: hypothetical protein VHC00_13605 [Rhizobiaceae bacterium]|nr:hypothetical protein [Rhizobiaceae bacterium]